MGYRAGLRRANRSKSIATASMLFFGLVANTLANNSAEKKINDEVPNGKVVTDSLTGIRAFTPGPWVNGDHQKVEVQREDGSTCEVTYTIKLPLGGFIPPLNPLTYDVTNIDDSDCREHDN